MSISVPKSWKDVKIHQYRQILNVKDLSDREKTLSIVSILSGVSKKTLLSMSASELSPIVSDLLFTNSSPSAEIITRFTVGEIAFGLIPDLNQLTVGEIMDLEEYVADWNNSIHKIVGVLYRPIIKEDKLSYEIEPYDSFRALKAAEIFDKDLSIEIGYATSLFFSIIGSVSWTSMKNSLMLH